MVSDIKQKIKALKYFPEIYHMFDFDIDLSCQNDRATNQKVDRTRLTIYL